MFRRLRGYRAVWKRYGFWNGSIALAISAMVKDAVQYFRELEEYCQNKAKERERCLRR